MSYHISSLNNHSRGFARGVSRDGRVTCRILLLPERTMQQGASWDSLTSGDLHERSDNVPNVQVTLPATLTSPEPAVVLDCDAGTVAEALRAAVAQAPRFAQRVFFKD